MDGSPIASLLRSIRSALWLIASILLVQFGSDVPPRGEVRILEILRITGLWVGLLMVCCVPVAILVQIARSRDESSSGN